MRKSTTAAVEGTNTRDRQRKREKKDEQKKMSPNWICREFVERMKQASRQANESPREYIHNLLQFEWVLRALARTVRFDARVCLCNKIRETSVILIMTTWLKIS